MEAYKENRTIVLICLLISLIGLVLMLIANFLQEYQVKDISQISEKDEGKKVLVEGKIVSVYNAKSVLIGNLCSENNSCIKIAFMPDFNERFFVEKGKRMKIIGKVQLYEDELEIVAERFV